MSAKISIIGAGSAVFSLNLIKDLCVNENLNGSELALMDINIGRLDSVYGLCMRYLKETGHNLKVTKTSDRRECIRNADFVIDVALDFGHQRLRDGWDIAYKNGYHFGGSMHIVHDEAFWVNFYQLRLMESIAEDILDICPHAYLIMVANPVLAGVTYLKRKYPGLKLVGMCHGYNGVNVLSRTIGLDMKDITYEVCGVNHFIWLTKYFYRGRDAFPILNQWIKEKSEKHFSDSNQKSSGEGKKAIDLYKRFGVFPIGDTCTPGGGSWGWWYHSEGQEEIWDEDPWTWYEGYFKGCVASVERIKSTVADPSQKVTEIFSGAASNEPMIPLIEALACDVEKKIIVNIPNDSCYVPGIPSDFEVEIPALVSKKGIQGIHTDGLPKPVMAYLWRDRIAPVEMELQAFITGDRNYLLSLIMMDPWTKSEKQANLLLDEILDMPCNKEMKEYFTKKHYAGRVDYEKHR